MSPEIHRTDIDGVPTVWADLPGPFTASLVFGVGVRDEPAHLMGITHLVEHLVFRAAGEILVSHNGGTEVDHTWFGAKGQEEHVVDFLESIARSLSSRQWSTQDLDLEKRIIEAEAGPRLAPSTGTATVRFGIGGPGNADAGVPTLPSLTIAELEAWRRTWFTRSNAALWLSGRPPSTLRLDLPEGPSPRRQEVVELASGPALVAHQKEGVALSLLAPSRDAPSLAGALAHELRQDLRVGRGLIYDVDVQVKPIGDGRRVVDLVLDPVAEDVADATRAAVGVLRRVAREGFSEAAVEFNRREAYAELTDPSRHDAYLDALCLDALGLDAVTEAPEVLLRHVQSVTADDLDALLRSCLDTLLVLANEDSERIDEPLASVLDLAFDDEMIWRSTTARPPRRGAFRGIGLLGRLDRIAIADGSIVAVVGGESREIPLDEVVVAGTFADGSLGLLDSRGRSTTLDVADWRGGHRLVDMVRNALPAETRRDFSWFDDPPHRREQT